MRYLSFGPENQTKFPICILTPKIVSAEILKAYITPFGIDPLDVIVIDLHQSEGKKKTPSKEQKEYITEELVDTLNDCRVEYLIVADADYFKTLTKSPQAERNLGSVMDSVYGDWKTLYVPNYKQIFYNPDKVLPKISQGMHALLKHRAGIYQKPGKDIIKLEAYPKTYSEISNWLDKIIEMDLPVSIDLETFSLKHNTAGIGTVSIAWSQHEGIAFAVDYEPIYPLEPTKKNDDGHYGRQINNRPVKALLLNFLLKLAKKARYHNIAFDVYILIYELFMADILDTEGLLNGLKHLLDDWDCTKLIAYLASNSCAGNELSLKDLAQEFAGNYALDEIKDIRKQPLHELLQYNLVDALSTNYVYDKYWPTLVADDQLDIYSNLFQPAMHDIIQMQLTGMPINMPRVKEVKLIMEADEALAVASMQQSHVITQFVYELEEEHIRKRNEKLKVKQIVIGDEPQEFNPNSGPQLQVLLFEHLGLPILSMTDGNQPSTDGDTIKALRNHTDNPDIIAFLEALSDYKAVNKLTTSFIPAMEEAALGSDGWHYLFGNFNLGGTISGRLSSSKPNLQNLPSNGKSDKQRYYAKLIKSCFQAPPGWLFCGLDFDSLEDKISALTTKDPNKLKVYTDGYDGHSLRAFSYFREQMPDILQSEGRRVFKIDQNGQEHILFSGDLVELPDGTTSPVEVYYSTL
jgi:DNA polymerase-1